MTDRCGDALAQARAGEVTVSSPDDRSPSFDIEAVRFTSLGTDEGDEGFAGVDVTLELCGPALMPTTSERYVVEWGGYESPYGICREYVMLFELTSGLYSTLFGVYMPAARYVSECRSELGHGYYHLVQADLSVLRDLRIEGNTITWTLTPGLIPARFDGVVEGRLWTEPRARTRTNPGHPVEVNAPGSSDGVTVAPFADDAGPGRNFEVGT